jgi:hypothetical protein
VINRAVEFSAAKRIWGCKEDVGYILAALC